jgi:tripeptide aminopeptidase
VHPGFAKGKMENAIRIGAAIMDALPKDKLSPETTEGRDGFIHATSFNATLEQAVIKLIIRDFTLEGLHSKEKFLKEICDREIKNYPKSTLKFEVVEQYRNMKEVLDKFPQVSAYAMQAMQRAGLKARTMSIRGGTDGSRLSFMGMPCPNIFAGEHAFHSKQEWVSVQDMQKAAETIIHLCMIWEENS